MYRGNRTDKQRDNDVNAGTQVKPATEQEPSPGSSTCDTTINCPDDDYCRYKANAKSYITRCNYDYYGGDIALGPTNSLADCANRCSTFSGCVAATWVGGMCYLKSGDFKIVYNAFVDSELFLAVVIGSCTNMDRCLP